MNFDHEIAQLKEVHEQVIAANTALSPTLRGFRDRRALVTIFCRPFDNDDNKFAALVEMMCVIPIFSLDTILLCVDTWFSPTSDGAVAALDNSDVKEALQIYSVNASTTTCWIFTYDRDEDDHVVWGQSYTYDAVDPKGDTFRSTVAAMAKRGFEPDQNVPNIPLNLSSVATRDYLERLGHAVWLMDRAAR